MAEVDIATLGIKVDASTADDAGNKLDNLTNKAENTERATKSVTSATAEMRSLMSQAIAAINSNTQALGVNTDQLNRNKTASRGAAAAVDDMESRIDKLRASIDPMGAAIDRVNAELAEARMLFEAGAMSAEDYARAQVVLNARSADFARRQGMMNAAMGIGARSAKLQTHEMLNLSRQFADIGVTAAMGMNPLMILVQQGPQIADVLSTARARGISASEAFLQMGQSIAPFLKLITGVGVVAGFAFGTLTLAAHGASEGLGNVQTELGLTEKQMDRLKDKGTELGYSMSDVGAGIASAIADAFNLDAVQEAWEDAIDYLGQDALSFVEDVVGWFGGMVNAIKVFFTDVPRSVGAVMIATLNIIIDTINDMVRRGTNVINNFLNALPDWVGLGKGNLQPFQLKNVANPLQDQMDNLTDAFGAGDRSARAAFRSGMASHRRARILEDAGDPEKGRKPRQARERKSEEEKDYESAVKGAESYIKALQKETEEMGKNRVEAKQLATEREIGELQAAAAALGTAEAMQKARNLTLQMRQAQDDWEQAVRRTSLRDFRIELNDLAEVEQFETSLIGLNHEAREKAMAQRQIDLKLRALERDGIHLTAEEIEQETNKILANAAARGRRADIVDAANRTATATRDMADAVREATDSFSELFGTAGEGYSNLINTIFDFNARQEEGYARLAELQEEYLSGQRDITDYTFERRRVEDEMAQAQIAHYGNMLGAAKTFFKEGSTGWKILEAAERVYRLFQFAMIIRSIFLDKASTTSSVANSGARATADGIAGVAKAIASLPFPLNIAAGAATLAFLVAIGVKMFGKGGGSKSASAAAKADVEKPEQWMGPRDKYGNPTSYYSVLQPGQTTVTGTGSAGNFNSGPGPGMLGGIRIGDTTLIVQGSLDSATIPQVQAMLDQNKNDTVQAARQVVQSDLSEQARRYRTGG